MTETQAKRLTINEGRTELVVYSQGKPLTFLHPPYGPDTYAGVERAIVKSSLATPTMSELVSLVHGTFNSEDNRYSKEIKGLMKDKWLWAFTEALYVPDKGAYIQDSPQISNGMPFMDESDLVRKLESHDSSVRFVPFGFKTGEQTPRELAANPFVIALAGEEGAEKSAEVAGNFKQKPYLWSFASVDEQTTRVSALLSYWSLGRRLCIDGYSSGDFRGGWCFGVRKTGEASAPEK